MITYQLYANSEYAKKLVDSVFTGEWAHIQTNQKYLEWLAEGNEPLPEGEA